MVHLPLVRIHWFIIAVLMGVVSVCGIVDPSIYTGVVSAELIPAAVGQDIISLVAAVLLFLLTLLIKPNQVKGQVVAIGIVGYVFYGYGIYVIEQVYNMWYLVYVVIWALSFWNLIYILATVDTSPLKSFVIPTWSRRTSIAIALLQPLVFIPMWVFALIPLIQTGDRVEYLFSIYIIDLVWVMPAFLILAWLLYKNHKTGIVFLPALFIVGFGIIFSLVVSELVKPFFGAVIKYDALWQSTVLSMLFLFATISHLRSIVRSLIR